MKKDNSLSGMQVGFYLLTSFIAFFPCLVLGQAYFGGDLTILFSIYHSFLKTALSQGQFPLWDPYVYAGQPFFADPNTNSAYPLLYPFLPFSVSYGITLFYFFHFFVAMVGMHFWLRNLGLSRASCVVGSLTFVFSGMFWGEIVHTPVFAAFTWLPWFFGFLEKYLADTSPNSAFASGLFLALIFLAGSPWVFLGTSYVGAVYFLFQYFSRNIRERKISLPELKKAPPKKIWGFFLFFLWGIIPMVVLALPFADFIRFSDRLLTIPDYESYAAVSIKPSEIYRFLFPLRCDNPFQNIPLSEMATLPTEAFLNLWTPFLALTALCFKERRRFKIFLLFLGGFFVLIGFGKYFPLHRWLFLHIPGFGWLRAPLHFRFVYQTTLCILGAMGFEHLKNAVSFSKSTRIWPFIYLGLIGLGAWLWEWKEWTLLALAVPGAIGLSLALVKSRTRFFGLWLFRVSFTASLLWGGWSFCSSPLGPSSNYDFQKEAPLISAIQEKIGSNRVFLGDHIPFPVETGGNIIPIDSPANISEVFHIKNAGGCNALSLLARGELYTTPFPTFLRLMDIQGFATGNEKGEVPDFQRFQWSGVKFYKSREEKSAVYAPTSWKVMENPVLRLEAMRRTNFNPYETTILSQPFSSTEPIENKGGKNKLSFKITKDGLNEQDFEIQIQKSGLVVFSEANYPGWRAWVDGQTTPIVTANHLFRGLNIPAGHHQVLFRFEPLIIRVSFFSILLWMLSAGLYWGVRGIQKISV